MNIDKMLEKLDEIIHRASVSKMTENSYIMVRELREILLAGKGPSDTSLDDGVSRLDRINTEFRSIRSKFSDLEKRVVELEMMFNVYMRTYGEEKKDAPAVKHKKFCRSEVGRDCSCGADEANAVLYEQRAYCPKCKEYFEPIAPHKCKPEAKVVECPHFKDDKCPNPNGCDECSGKPEEKAVDCHCPDHAEPHKHNVPPKMDDKSIHSDPLKISIDRKVADNFMRECYTSKDINAIRNALGEGK